jgi:SagB-type dehydrogenase family enzyme
MMNANAVDVESTDARLYQLSTYAYISVSSQGPVLRSPRTRTQLVLSDQTLLQLILCFTNAISAETVIAAVPVSQQNPVIRLIQRCYEEKFLVLVKEDGTTTEDTDMSHWEFHDLLFHSQSRAGRQHQPIGATYRFAGIPSPDQPRSADDDHTKPLDLYSPDIIALQSRDVSLTTALETRRSRRIFSPLTDFQLGEFLYRSCRAIPQPNERDARGAWTTVYPSAGNLHPLEIYPVVLQCSGIDPGIYHYEPQTHQMKLIRPHDDQVSVLVEDGITAAGRPQSSPAILFVIAARFRRTAWKYESIAYHLILVELGALIQTMYLVATAMNLSACALGSGDSDRFANLIGSNYYLETSVGELLLGSAMEDG